jgi:small-conductance mechanosensitive channel
MDGAVQTVQETFLGPLATVLAFGPGGVDAARGLISGMAMGSMLQPGQRVRIGQGAGTVVRHDMNTTIVDTDHGQISIPNSTLSSEHIEMLGADGMQQSPRNPRQPAGAP